MITNKYRGINTLKRCAAYPFAKALNWYNRVRADGGFILDVPDWKHNFPSWTVDLNSSVEVQTRHGFSVVCDAHDYIGRHIIKNKEWEPLIGKAIDALLPHNGIAIDIGANMGVHSLKMAQRAHDGWVYSFEPDLCNMVALVNNISRNNVRNIVPIGIALSDQSCIMDMNVRSGVNYGTSSLRMSETTGAIQRVIVSRMDQLPIGANYPVIDFVKIDVEGLELEVILGFGALLKIVRYLVCEINPQWTNVTRLMRILRDEGFDYIAAPPSEHSRWYQPSTRVIEGQHDALFYREWSSALEGLLE